MFVVGASQVTVALAYPATTDTLVGTEGIVPSLLVEIGDTEEINCD